MESIFEKNISDKFIARIEKLNADTAPSWGKMSVDQMLAHCNVTYEMAFDNTHPKPGFLKQFILKLFVKNIVVGPAKYGKNKPTAPQFIIKGDKNFENEKKRLIEYIIKTQELGASYFEGKDSNSFGPLSSGEWNTMFSKHLDHHLTQFGV